MVGWRNFVTKHTLNFRRSVGPGRLRNKKGIPRWLTRANITLKFFPSDLSPIRPTWTVLWRDPQESSRISPSRPGPVINPPSGVSRLWSLTVLHRTRRVDRTLRPESTWTGCTVVRVFHRSVSAGHRAETYNRFWFLNSENKNVLYTQFTSK